MNAEVLTIGDELLIGQVVNTNASWIGEALNLVGVEVVRMVTLGDEVEQIHRELDEAFRKVELVIITGGLGATHDDVTKVAVADYFDRELVFDSAAYAQVKARFDGRGRKMPESNRSQAMVPDGFTVIPNLTGTAPGLWYDEEIDGQVRIVVVMPGVPFEMKKLMNDEVLPRLSALRGRRNIVHKTLLTSGIGETSLQDLLGNIGDHLSDTLRLAYLPSTSGVRLRLTSIDQDAEAAQGKIEALEARIRDRAERYIFSTGNDTLEAAVGRMLLERGLTLGVAESCTGGYVGDRLTSVSGASAYFLGGVVAYCNSIKIGLLGVNADTLETAGAVSEPVAKQMAMGIRRRANTDIGVSTTGIMGPTGGTPDKPVGTVWIGYADADHVTARRVKFSHTRQINKELASSAALYMVRLQLMREKA